MEWKVRSNREWTRRNGRFEVSDAIHGNESLIPRAFLDQVEVIRPMFTDSSCGTRVPRCGTIRWVATAKQDVPSALRRAARGSYRGPRYQLCDSKRHGAANAASTFWHAPLRKSRAIVQVIPRGGNLFFRGTCTVLAVKCSLCTYTSCNRFSLRP